MMRGLPMTRVRGQDKLPTPAATAVRVEVAVLGHAGGRFSWSRILLAAHHCFSPLALRPTGRRHRALGVEPAVRTATSKGNVRTAQGTDARLTVRCYSVRSPPDGPGPLRRPGGSVGSVGADGATVTRRPLG